MLWPWCRLAAAAPIQHLAWELPYATGTTLKRQKKFSGKKKFNIELHIRANYQLSIKRVGIIKTFSDIQYLKNFILRVPHFTESMEDIHHENKRGTQKRGKMGLEIHRRKKGIPLMMVCKAL